MPGDDRIHIVVALASGSKLNNQPDLRSPLRLCDTQSMPQCPLALSNIQRPPSVYALTMLTLSLGMGNVRLLEAFLLP